MFVQKDGTPGLDPDSAENFKTVWRNKYGGVTSSNAREWPLLPPGITPQRHRVRRADAGVPRDAAVHARRGLQGVRDRAVAHGRHQRELREPDMYHQMLYQDTLTPLVHLDPRGVRRAVPARSSRTVDSGFAL